MLCQNRFKLQNLHSPPKSRERVLKLFQYNQPQRMTDERGEYRGKGKSEGKCREGESDMEERNIGKE